MEDPRPRYLRRPCLVLGWSSAACFNLRGWLGGLFLVFRARRFIDTVLEQFAMVVEEASNEPHITMSKLSSGESLGLPAARFPLDHKGLLPSRARRPPPPALRFYLFIACDAGVSPRGGRFLLCALVLWRLRTTGLTRRVIWRCGAGLSSTHD